MQCEPEERWNPYGEDLPSKTCPVCRGSCYEDEYEIEECTRCEGEGVIYLVPEAGLEPARL